MPRPSTEDPSRGEVPWEWPHPPVDLALTSALLMDRTVDQLIEEAKREELWPELYERGQRVLEGLPLPTGGHQRARGRLCNALSYSRSGEFGAAAFELRMLRGQLIAE